MEDRAFTRAELLHFDGREGRPAYVAFDGKVYDLSASASWDAGLHYEEHEAGTDLSEAMAEAPHDPDELERFPVVGRLEE
jgi:predicted heme/steroid binding protein